MLMNGVGDGEDMDEDEDSEEDIVHDRGRT